MRGGDADKQRVLDVPAGAKGKNLMSKTLEATRTIAEIQAEIKENEFMKANCDRSMGYMFRQNLAYLRAELARAKKAGK